MMTFIWIVSACVLAVVWVLSIVDILRRRYSTGTTIGWIALVLVLPFVGSVIYWLLRKPTAAEVDAAYLAEADFRRGGRTAPSAHIPRICAFLAANSSSVRIPASCSSAKRFELRDRVLGGPPQPRAPARRRLRFRVLRTERAAPERPSAGPGGARRGC